MGKQKHSKDRLFITQNEYRMDWGGKKDPKQIPISRLPFDCCSLSLLPFENPVCSPDGIIFDIMNIIPYLKQYKKNPVTGSPLKFSDLTKLKFQKNSSNEYIDPISYKPFTEFTHIVAIKTTGNVYSYETIESLNRKPKYWLDLLNNEPFTVKDILTLQDPKNIEKRLVKNFDYVQKDLKVDKILNSSQSDASKFINQNSSQKKILAEVKKNLVEEEKKKQEKEQELGQIKKKVHKELDQNTKNSTNYFVQEQLSLKKLKHDKFTCKTVANSVTSTYFEPSYDGQNEFRLLNEDEIRQLYYTIAKETNPQGKVQLNTSLGPITIRLYCNYAPKTCENFLELCEKKYFDNTIFHRLVQNFIVQGGDPTKSGYGGESIFGHAFQDEFHEKLTHNRSGLVSMANSGPDTNKSQFFITLNECKHLDNKHTIFGEVIEGLSILDLINSFSVNEQYRPKPQIKIFDTVVIYNPFREAIKMLKENNCDKKLVLDSYKSQKTKGKQQQNPKEKEDESNDLLQTLLND